MKMLRFIMLFMYILCFIVLPANIQIQDISPIDKLDDMDFCGRTILVVLTPEVSEFTGTRSANFFGDIEIESVENIFQIHNENAIKALKKQGREFRSIYLITLPKRSKELVLAAIEELKLIKGIEHAGPNYILTTSYSFDTDEQESTNFTFMKA